MDSIPFNRCYHSRVKYCLGDFKEGFQMVSIFRLVFISLSICDFYREIALRVKNGEWTGLEDTVPTMSLAL